jgi:glycerophosphoryl diester phosphodiesterase
MRFTVIGAALIAALAPFAAADPPLVIAHRGASGYLPEHTLVTYAMAYTMGADYIEPDLVLTKDNRFICLHDIHLDDTTDVETKFPDRARPDGHWYAADFALAEIKQLAAHERLDNRFRKDSRGFQVPTFEEMIELVQGLNAATGRNVGIYPELKQPAWHASQDLPMEHAALDLLAKYGYSTADSPIFLQCFEAESLIKIRRELGSRLPLILLVGNGREADATLSESGLAAVAKYANGIGPDRTLIERKPQIVEWAHAANLAVHPYTFRTDAYNKSKYDSYEAELRQFLTVYKIDGFFTDQPDRGVAVVAGLSPGG